MATYKDMNNHPNPPIEDNFVAAGKVAGKGYLLSVGPIRITLTKDEKEQTLFTWSQLDNGINPETNKKFTESEISQLKSQGAY